MRLSDDIERLALEWSRARHAFLNGATVKDAATKLPVLADPQLLNDLAVAENALHVECQNVLRQLGTAA